MTLKFAMPCITIGLALLVGSAAAQGTATVEKNQHQTPAATTPQAEAATPRQVETPPAKAEPPPKQPADNQAVEPTVQSHKDKVSYAFGVDLARDLKQQKNDLNVNLLIKALTDALADKPLVMTDGEVTATLKKYQEEQKQDYEHAKAMIAERNRREGEAFFSENARKEGVVTLPSGLQYKVLKKGDGKTPTPDDKVVCQYRATLVNGTEFDSSYKRNRPATLPVKGVMQGWAQALQLMPVGSKWQIVIPPQLAYGDKIVGGLGPNATLIFEVELLSIQDKPQTASAAK